MPKQAKEPAKYRYLPYASAKNINGEWINVYQSIRTLLNSNTDSNYIVALESIPVIQLSKYIDIN